MSRLIALFFAFFFIRAGAQNSRDTLLYYSFPDTTILLDEIRVVAYRVSGKLHNVPGSLSVITEDALRSADGISLAAAINALPGVTMQTGTHTTSRIVIRGMGSRTPYNTNRIRAYLNDIPLTTSDGVSTPEELPFSVMDKIEIIKGPASALYGSGLGGSINMYTPVRTKDQGRIEAYYGAFNTAKADLSGSVNRGKANGWGSVNHISSDGYRENNHYRRTTMMSAGRLEHDRWSLNATLLFIGVNGGIPSSLGKTLFEDYPKAAAPNWNAIGGFKKYAKGLAASTLTNYLSPRLNNQLTVFGRLNDNYEKRPFNNLDDISLSGGIRNKISLNTRKTDLVAGIEWITENYKWKLDKDGSLINRNSETRKQINIFTILYYRPIPELNISFAGALNHISYRLSDHYPSNGDQSGARSFPLIVSPRAGINYAPDEHIAFYASAGHGFSLPSPEETLLPEGEVNRALKPEQGIQYEAGTRLTLFSGKMEVDATLYLIALNDLLVTKRITEDIFTGINAGRTRHHGFELLLRNTLFEYGRFPGKLMSAIAYTGSINRFIDFTDDGISYDGNILPGIPRQSWQFRLNWQLSKFSGVFLNMQYSGRQFLNDSNTLSYPGYIVVNVRAMSDFMIRKKLPFSIYAGVNNLTNTQYASMLVVNARGFNGTEPRYYYPGMPVHGYTGIQLRF